MIRTKGNNSITNNMDKLPLEVIGMISILFRGKIEGFENAYMVEIKLDDPLKHIKEGDDGFIIHQSIDQYQSKAKHLWDEEWAVLHKNIFKMTTVDEDRFETIVKKYLDTGELTQNEVQTNSKRLQEVRRKRF